MPFDSSHSSLKQAALNYHEFPKPGKLEIRPTKPMATGRDLSLAYSPGVAEACLAIKDDPLNISRFTARGNLVAVISNGSAVLGLGNIGAKGAKPVMEGKAVLFKKFANLDCFDIEINESDPVKLAETIIRLEPTFGAINLEDIKAPDCFEVERICKEQMNIPVFHDDQHGTAIVVAAALINALKVTGKNVEKLKVVALGAGAAGIACLDFMVAMGIKKDNIILCDRNGVIRADRCNDLDTEKQRYARDISLSTLEEAVVGADFFLGLSGPNTVSQSMIKSMAPQPMVFTLANPNPEIWPSEVLEAVPDALICTGRSDYPNQVNNVLCFPFIFRGALDVGATTINFDMKLACAEALAELARESTSEEVGRVYADEQLTFGSHYLIPKPFDPRLLPCVASAVAAAAVRSGVATRPRDIQLYREALESQVYKSSMLMRPVFDIAKKDKRRIVFAEGEDQRVLYSVQLLTEEHRCKPILIGRPDVIAFRIEKAGLSIVPERDFEIVNPNSDSRFAQYWQSYYGLVNRRGVSPYLARTIVRSNTTVIAALMVHRREAESMICGTVGQYLWHLNYVKQILAKDGLTPIGALSTIVFDTGTIFTADTQVNTDPTPEQIAQTTIAAARHVRRFGVEPHIAICSDSQFGNLDSLSGHNAREAMVHLEGMEVDFDYEGEMTTDIALNPELRMELFPHSRMTEKANTLIYTSSSVAGAARHLLKGIGNGVEIGPILMGMGNTVHIVNPSVTARGVYNSASLALMPISSYG